MIGAAIVSIAAFCTAMSTGVGLLSGIIGLFLYGAAGAIVGGGTGAVVGAILGSVTGLLVPRQGLLCAPAAAVRSDISADRKPEASRLAGVVPGNTPVWSEVRNAGR